MLLFLHCFFHSFVPANINIVVMEGSCGKCLPAVWESPLIPPFFVLLGCSFWFTLGDPIKGMCKAYQLAPDQSTLQQPLLDVQAGSQDPWTSGEKISASSGICLEESQGIQPWGERVKDCWLIFKGQLLHTQGWSIPMCWKSNTGSKRPV